MYSFILTKIYKPDGMLTLMFNKNGFIYFSFLFFSFQTFSSSSMTCENIPEFIEDTKAFMEETKSNNNDVCDNLKFEKECNNIDSDFCNSIRDSREDMFDYMAISIDITVSITHAYSNKIDSCLRPSCSKYQSEEVFAENFYKCIWKYSDHYSKDHCSK